MYIYIYIYYNYTQCGWWRLSAELQFCETIQEDRWGQSTAVTVTLRQSKMASWQIPELNGAFDRNMIELNEKKVQCFIPALSDRLCEFLVFSRPKNCCHLQAVCENQHPKKTGSSSKARPVQHMENLWESWMLLKNGRSDHAGSCWIIIYHDPMTSPQRSFLLSPQPREIGFGHQLLVQRCFLAAQVSQD